MSYQHLIRDRIRSFDTFIYFLSAGVIIQFVFLIIASRKARLTGEELKYSEDVLFLLNKEREKERLHIGSYLHDTVLQEIGSLILSSEMNGMENTSEKLRQISNDLREMTYRLSPLQLNSAGLIGAVNDLIQVFKNSNSNTSITFSRNGFNEDMLDAEERLVFFRIIQESLTNISKHADAELVRITLVSSHPFLIMRIRDNGRGISPAAEGNKSGHFGLRLMNHQAKSIGAVLTVKSIPRHGTTIILKHKIGEPSNNE